MDAERLESDAATLGATMEHSEAPKTTATMGVVQGLSQKAEHMRARALAATQSGILAITTLESDAPATASELPPDLVKMARDAGRIKIIK